MKYKTKIVPQDGGYIGYALQNDEVVLTSNVHKDAIMAARELSTLINNAQESPASVPSSKSTPVVKSPLPKVTHSVSNHFVPLRRPTPAAPQGIAQPSAPSAPTRRCCGRG